MVLRQAFAPESRALKGFLEAHPRAPEGRTRKEKGWERSSQPEAEGRMMRTAETQHSGLFIRCAESRRRKSTRFRPAGCWRFTRRRIRTRGGRDSIFSL